MSARALVAEPSIPVAQTLKKYLEAAGCAVKLASSAEEALEHARAHPPELVFASALGLNGQALCQKLKKGLPLVQVVLVYPPEDEDPEQHAAAANADAYLVGPLKRATVVVCAKAMLQIRSLREQIERLENEKKKPARRVTEEFLAEAPQTPDFEFFKKLLLMEVKRSRRYRYPVSFLLVGLDRFQEQAKKVTQADRTEVLSEALRVLSRGVRDIDLVVPFQEARFLVFLPHTAQDGAAVVAARFREKLQKLKAPWDVTASVGVAAYQPTKSQTDQVSFGSLMKEATEALRRAQLAGGDRVEAPAAKPKRDRISLG